MFRALRAAGIPRRSAHEYVKNARSREPLRPEVVDQVLMLYAAGAPVSAVAEQLGLPYKRVYKLLQAVARYLAGDSPRIIGRALGVSAARVYLALPERGVVRTRSEARLLAAGGQRVPEGWEAAVEECNPDGCCG